MALTQAVRRARGMIDLGYEPDYAVAVAAEAHAVSEAAIGKEL